MNLNDLASELQSVFQDWAPRVVNLRGKRIDNALSWPDRRIVKSNRPVTRGDVLMMDMDAQYSMQIAEDGALIRLYYVFDASKQRLVGASLGYYSTLPALIVEGNAEGQPKGEGVDALSPEEEEKAGIFPEQDMIAGAAPESTHAEAVPEKHAGEFEGILPVDEIIPEGAGNVEAVPEKHAGEFEGILPVELEAEPVLEITPHVPPDDAVVSWIRIDFDPSAKRKGVLHHDCHLHVAGFPHMRVPVTAVPSPRQFVDLVMATCYPEFYRENRLADPHSFIDLNHYERIGNACLRLDNFEWLGGVTSLLIPLGGADARVRAAAQRRAEEENKKAVKAKNKSS